MRKSVPALLLADAHADESIPIWAITLAGRNRTPRVRALLDRPSNPGGMGLPCVGMTRGRRGSIAARELDIRDGGSRCKGPNCCHTTPDNPPPPTPRP